jgi:O-antigen/teichoic acid export membrane protein
VFASAAQSEKKFRLRTAMGGPIGLLLPLRHQSAELGWVLAGKFTLIGANAAAMLFLARWLELETYGLMVITISCQLLISRLLIAGVDAGLVRLTALPELKERAGAVVSAGLVFIGWTSAGLVVLSLFAVPVLSSVSIPIWILLSIVVGAVGTSLVDYGYSFRLARNEYPFAALAQGGTALWRLGLIILAVFALPALPIAVFLAYHGASLLSGLAQTLFITRNSQRPDRALMRRLLRYSIWQGKASVIVIFCLYQGTFLLMILNQPAATGIFGLGLTLSLGFFAIYSAYSEYLHVQVGLIEDISAVPRFMVRAETAALILILACVPIIFAVAKLIPLLFGPEWQEVVPTFIYLAASMVLLIAQAPLVAACHYLLKPQLITLGWAMRAVIVGFAGLILFAQVGAIGVAIAQLIGSVLGLLILSWFVFRFLRAAIFSAAPRAPINL